ncbi:MAG: bifunctional UDP-sugar hydrolase/5'-nucleotidase [Methylococcales bacterium]
MFKIYRLLIIALLLSLSACSTSPQKTTFTLLQLNDVYEISPLNAGKTGGLARVATLQKQLKAANEHTYSVLAGDLLSPSAIGTSIYNGEPLAGKQMISVFNQLHWDYATFGNHEFDIGKKALLQRLAEAKTIFFSSNVLDSDTKKPLAHSQETVILNVDDVKVGLIGITLPELKPNFVSISDPMTAAQKAIQQLKPQVDLIVLVTHQDVKDDIVFAEKLTDVDLIIGGHEHENMYLFRGEKLVPITKADANAKSAFIHTISIDKQSGAKSIESKLVFLDESMPLDAETDVLVKQWQQQAFELFKQQGFDPKRVVCHTKEPLDGLEASVRNKPTALTEVLAKAFLHAYPEADLSLYNSGSIRIDDIIPAGAITEYDVIKIMPFGGRLNLVQLSGELIEKALNANKQNQGKGSFLHFANISQVNGQWLINKQAIDIKRLYKVVLTDFLVEKGDKGLGFLTFKNNSTIKRLDAPPIDVRKALIQELLLLDKK